MGISKPREAIRRRDHSSRRGLEQAVPRSELALWALRGAKGWGMETRSPLDAPKETR